MLPEHLGSMILVQHETDSDSTRLLRLFLFRVHSLALNHTPCLSAIKNSEFTDSRHVLISLKSDFLKRLESTMPHPKEVIL